MEAEFHEMASITLFFIIKTMQEYIQLYTREVRRGITRWEIGMQLGESMNREYVQHRGKNENWSCTQRFEVTVDRGGADFGYKRFRNIDTETRIAGYMNEGRWQKTDVQIYT
jgi:hypothetical protein